MLLVAGQAGAASFTMSDISSDSTPAAQLKALIDVSVSGSTLNVSIRSQTAASAPFDIGSLYFNASPDVIGLTYTGAREGNSSLWGFYDSGRAVNNWKFGTFDFALHGSASNAAALILHGHSNLFSFSILCKQGVVCDASDFFSGMSQGGDLSALGGLRFVNGPGGDGAFGGTGTPIPEPSTALLLTLGLVGLARTAGTRQR
jgi:hypothetical protein